VGGVLFFDFQFHIFIQLFIDFLAGKFVRAYVLEYVQKPKNGLVGQTLTRGKPISYTLD
jgi:hypothetical protein